MKYYLTFKNQLMTIVPNDTMNGHFPPTTHIETWGVIDKKMIGWEMTKRHQERENYIFNLSQIRNIITAIRAKNFYVWGLGNNNITRRSRLKINEILY